MPSYTATQIISQAAIELGVQNYGQVLTDDVYSGALIEVNLMVDNWAAERLFVWKGTSPTYTLFTGFSDLTTAVAFAPGYLALMQHGAAIQLCPSLKQYFKIPDPLVVEIQQKFTEARAAVEGTAPQ